MDKVQSVLQAVEKLKICPYKATAIKIELEANIEREDSCEYFLKSWLEAIGSSGYDIQGYGDEAFAYDVTPEIAYVQVYNDGSVDTEITFTLKLDNPENVLLIPKYIEAFRDVSRRYGEIFDTQGAGMHLALLNNRNCEYPSGISSANMTRFNNFARSLRLLLPALYFLATPNESSRGLEFRRPQISFTRDEHGYGKFNAITYKGGALEFRLFDTCYDKPEAVFDDICVMANCMKYWRMRFKNPKLDRICHSISFGKTYGYDLERFYCRMEHIDLLNAGLKLLRPDYYTIKELKQQRNFKVDKNRLQNTIKEFESQASNEYEEYQERSLAYRQDPRISKIEYITKRANGLISNFQNSDFILEA
jgi:hypothetical protein